MVNTANDFIKKLKDIEAKVIIFDLDQTACKAHSYGILQRKQLEKYIKHASKHFLEIVPLLKKEGFQLAIATNNDTRIVEWLNEEGDAIFKQDKAVVKRNKKRLVAGDELTRTFLGRSFGKKIAREFYVVAVNANLHPENQRMNSRPGKNYHLDLIAAHYKVGKEQCVLFDDQKANVDSFEGVAFLVDPLKGFTLDVIK